jgi:hypothetical protein
MPYKVALQVRHDHVRAEVTGNRRLGDAATNAGLAGKQIVELCRNTGIYRVLVVLDLAGRLSALDSYEMVVNSKEYGWSHAFKLAFVEKNGESFDDSLFTETVAVNRSYAVKVFADETDAIEWLLNPAT